MIHSLARNFYVLAALCCCMSGAHAQLKIMTIGDSITRGFPNNNDSDSYPRYLRDALTTAPTFVGDSDEAVVPDGLAATNYMVGNNGSVIDRINIVFNSTGTGVKERLKVAVDGGAAAPDYVVILIGFNDIVELINPTDSDDWFVPGTVMEDFSDSGGSLPAGNGDYRSGGIFIDGGVNRSAMTYGSNPSPHVVLSIKDRYEDLLDEVVAAFPTTHVILVTVPIPDADGLGGDPQYAASDRPLVKETVANYNLQVAELAATDDRFTCVNPRLIRPINITDAGSPAYVASTDLYDGVHPSVAGYEKIGEAVASVILYRLWVESMFPTDFSDPSKEATIWGSDADPDNDGWGNGLEHYLAMDPNTSDLPMIMTTVSGSNFTYIYEMNEDVVVRSMDIEYSTDLSTWTPDDLTPRSAAPLSGGLIQVTTTLTVNPWDRVFFRLIRPVQ